MNKNDVLRIAKSLYLQEMISRQLFAKFDPNKQLGMLDGSFARLPQRIQAVFYGFIGSRQRTKYPQIVQKNGMKFKIHKINTDNTVSEQIYNNTEYDINQVAFILRKLYVTAQKGGYLSFKNSIKQVEDLWNKPLMRKTNKERCQTIIDKFQQIKQVFIAISDLIVGDIDYISQIRNLQEEIGKLKKFQKLDKESQQYKQTDSLVKNFIANFKQFVNNKQSYVQVINMAVNRLKAFVQLYNTIKSELQNEENQKLEYILRAMQQCNTNKQIGQTLNEFNLKEYLDKSYTDLTQQDNAIQAFIRFVKNIDNSSIEVKPLNSAIQYYLNLPNGVISQNTKNTLEQLKQFNEEFQEKLQLDKKSEDPVINGTCGVLRGNNISDQLKNKIKMCKNQLV